MTTSPPRSASRFEGDIPTEYEAGLRPYLFEYYARDLARRSIENHPKSVLELAAGTGILTRHLMAGMNDQASLLATDLNDDMLEIARRCLLADGRLELQAVDATDLPYDAGSFDAMACQFGVMFFPDKLQGFTHACRVLRPGGRYFFNVWRSWDENPFARIAHNTMANFFKSDPPGFYKVPFGYHNVEEISSTVMAAGFSEITSQNIPHTVQLDDIEAFARGLVFGNPCADQIRSQGGDVSEVLAAVINALGEAFGADGNMPLEATVFEARK